MDPSGPRGILSRAGRSIADTRPRPKSRLGAHAARAGAITLPVPSAANTLNATQ